MTNTMKILVHSSRNRAQLKNLCNKQGLKVLDISTQTLVRDIDFPNLDDCTHRTGTVVTLQSDLSIRQMNKRFSAVIKQLGGKLQADTKDSFISGR